MYGVSAMIVCASTYDEYFGQQIFAIESMNRSGIFKVA